MSLIGTMVCVGTLAFASQAPTFSDAERQAVQTFWSQPGRYAAEPRGPWQVRLTPEGSLWLWNYNRARGITKVAPTQDAAPQNDEQLAWEGWIDGRVNFDRNRAGEEAAKKNGSANDQPAAADPGPIPPALLALAGPPPPFAEAVMPSAHRVDFGDGFRLDLTDNVDMRPRYPYYRFREGVMMGGKSVRSLPAEDVQALFADAGISGSELKVMQAVSLLEGGFESINTYDTGFVSVGFIQFACLRAGAGSLGQVLAKMKTTDPVGFTDDFRRFGIDVTPEGALACVDPATGSFHAGPDAAGKIIADKRLIAVFARAGTLSWSFRVSQLQVARERFYPGEDVITVAVNGAAQSAVVGDLVKTEAGLATLMDRKVNTGRLDPLPEVIAKIMVDRGLTRIEEVTAFETDLIRAMRYRKDYLADLSLSRPKDAIVQPSSPSRSGGGKRNGGGSGGGRGGRKG